MKHVDFYSKNKFEKLMHLVCFVIRIYHDARSPECQIIQGLSKRFERFKFGIFYILIIKIRYNFTHK